MLQEVGHWDQYKQKWDTETVVLTSFAILFATYRELIFLPKLVDTTVSVYFME